MNGGERRWFTGNGVRLAATAFGDPSRPAICFLPGGGQSRRAWSRAARLVADADYYGICIDLRGHGESEWARDGDYALDAYARDVECLFDQLTAPLTLVGASRGGQACLVGGTRRQDRLRLILLADVLPENRATGIADIRTFLNGAIDGYATLADAALALSCFTGNPSPADPTGLEKAMRHHHGRLFWHWDPRMAALEFLSAPGEKDAMYDAARALRRPIVLVRAERDSLATDEMVDRFRDAAPQLVVETAPGARHMITGDDNALFAARLLHHLDQA